MGASKKQVDFSQVDMDVISEDISAASASATRQANKQTKAPHEIAKHASHLSRLTGNVVDCTPVPQTREQVKDAKVNNTITAFETELKRIDTYGLVNTLDQREQYFATVDIEEHDQAQANVAELITAYAEAKASLPQAPTIKSGEIEPLFKGLAPVRLPTGVMDVQKVLNSVNNCSTGAIDDYTKLLEAAVKGLKLRKALDNNHAKNMTAHNSKVAEVNALKAQALVVAKANPRAANSSERMFTIMKRNAVVTSTTSTSKSKKK